MKTRNLVTMTLLLGVVAFAPQMRGQITREQVSARIRSHIHSSTAVAGSAQQGGGEEYGSSESGFGPLNVPYGAGDLWLDVPVITNDIVFLTLHNTQSNMYCQLLTNLDLRFPKVWGYGQIVRATNDTTLFAPEPMFGRDKTFYRAVEGFPIVKIVGFQDAIEPTNASSGQPGLFEVLLSDTLSTDVTIFYKISGSAQNGVDYSNIT
jgi:hypothetical protein